MSTRTNDDSRTNDELARSCVGGIPAVDIMCLSAHTDAMSPKQRFPVMLEPEQVAALREIEARTGARISEQIRRAIDDWLAKQGGTTADRRRASTRRRP